MFKEFLNKNNFKATPKRLEILKLLENKKQYFSVIEIYDFLKKKFNKIGISTVYRIIHELVRIKIVGVFFSESSKEMNYFLCLDKDSNHHHFFCIKCKKIECINFCVLSRLKEITEKQLKGKLTNHIMQIEGICSDCRRQL